MSVERRGTKALELWAKRVTQGYEGVSVDNMTTSWRDGLAFCALIHYFKPEIIDFKSLKRENMLENNALAFRVAEQQLGIPALLDAEDMVDSLIPDRLSILTYVSQFYQAFAAQGLLNAGGLKKVPPPSPSKQSSSADASLSPSKITSSPSKPLPSAVVSTPAKAQPISQPPATLQTKRETEIKTDKAPLGMRGRREECYVCHKPVFLAERVLVGCPVHIRHRTCFRCARCSGQLTLANYYETEKGDFCCETCPDEEKSLTLERSLRVKLTAASESLSDSESSSSQDSSANVSLSPNRSISSLGSEALTRSDYIPQTASRTTFLLETLKSSSDSTVGMDGHISENICANNVDRRASSPRQDNSLRNPPDFEREMRISPPIDTVDADEKSTHHPDNKSNNTCETGNDDEKNNNGNLSQNTHTVSDPPIKVPSLNSNDNAYHNKTNTFYEQNDNTEHNSLVVKEGIKPHSEIESKITYSIDSERRNSAIEALEAKLLLKMTSRNEIKECSPFEPSLKINEEKMLDDVPQIEKEEKIKNIIESNSQDRMSEIMANEASINFVEESIQQEKVDISVENFEIKPEGKVVEDKSEKYEESEEQPETIQPPIEEYDKLQEKVVSLIEETQEKIDCFDDPKKQQEDCDFIEESKKQEEEIKVEASINGSEKLLEEDDPLVEDPAEEREKISPHVDANIVESVLEEFDYPTELNPFGDDEEITPPSFKNENLSIKNGSVSPEEGASILIDNSKEKDKAIPFSDNVTKASVEDSKKKKVIKASLNPFDDSDDEAIETTISKSIKQSTNPFWSEEEDVPLDVPKAKIKPPRPPPPTLKRNELTPKKLITVGSESVVYPPSPTPSSLSGGSADAALKIRKKLKPAPQPPSLSPIQGHKDTVLSSKMQKNMKNQNNKLTAEIPLKTEANQSSILKPKSEVGEWRRKKGPAPPRPTPQKRVLRGHITIHKVQQELYDIEVKQTELERQGVLLETSIRERTERQRTNLDETNHDDSNKNVSEADSGPPISLSSNSSGPSSIEIEDMILQLFELVNEKNELLRRQTELMYIKRERRLEEEYAELEYQIRCLMMKPPSEKTPEDVLQEEELVQRLCKVVDLRDEVINCLEMERQREAIEDESIASHMMRYQERYIEGIIDSNEEIETKKKKKKRLKLLKKKKKKKDKERSSSIDIDKDVDETELKKLQKVKKKNWFRKSESFQAS